MATELITLNTSIRNNHSNSVSVGNRTNRVCVYCRLAPSKESEALCLSALDAEARSIELQRDNHPIRHYQFDGIFSPNKSSQFDVFETVAKDLVDDVLSGWNATCLAYGQTGTGKTYTMLGPALGELVDGTISSSSSSNNNTIVSPTIQNSQFAGIIPRAVSRIFDQLSLISDNSSFTVQASYVQLYCESVYDLLQGYSIGGDRGLTSPGGNNNNNNINSGTFLSSSSSLQIREDPETGVFVEGATWVNVEDMTQCLSVLAAGSRNRAVAATLMNAQSSRSHAIFMLRVERRIPASSASSSSSSFNSSTSTPKSAAALVARVQRGTLFLVDLAGSERQSRSGVAGVHLDEMRAINLSLSALGNCISALASRGDASRTSSSVHVPYRDSKLTRLLQDSLGGNSRTSLIITVSQAAHSALETQSTLEFGSRAAKVTVHAVRNEVVDYRALYMALKLGNNSVTGVENSESVVKNKNPDGYVLVREDEFSKLKEREAALSEEVNALRAITAEGTLLQSTDFDNSSSSSSSSSLSSLRSRPPTPSSTIGTLQEINVSSSENISSGIASILSPSSIVPATAKTSTTISIGTSPMPQTSIGTSPMPQTSIGTSPMPQTLTSSASVNTSITNNNNNNSIRANPPGSIVFTVQAQEVLSRQLAKLKAELGMAKSDLDKSQDSLLSAVREQRKLKERVKEAEKELTVRVSTLLEEVNEARGRAEEAEEKARIAEDEAELARKELRSSISGGGGAIHAARAGAVSEVTRLYEASISGLQKRVSKVEERCQSQATLVQELAHRLRVRERQVQVQKLQTKRAQEALWKSQGGGGGEKVIDVGGEEEEEEQEQGVLNSEIDCSQDSLSGVLDPIASGHILSKPVSTNMSIPVGSGVSAVTAALRQRPMSEGSGVRALNHSRSTSLLEQHSHAISSASERDIAQMSSSLSLLSSSTRHSTLQLKPVLLGGVGSLVQTQPAPVPRLSSASIAVSNAALYGLGARPMTSGGLGKNQRV
jgi:hypothetical protein